MKRNPGLVFFTIAISFISSVVCADDLNIPMPNALKDSQQLIVVVTDNWNSQKGQLLRFHRDQANAAWQSMNSPVTVAVGKNGLAWSGDLFGQNALPGPIKKEGDDKSPAGVFALGPAFGSAAQTASTKLFYLPIKQTTICVNDPSSHFYGRILDSTKIGNKDWKTSQNMYNSKKYEYGVVVDYNMAAPKPGIGSCIFLHVWQGGGTDGSTAGSKDLIFSLLNWLNPDQNPVIVQLPKDEYQRLQNQWGLPKLTSL